MNESVSVASLRIELFGVPRVRVGENIVRTRVPAKTFEVFAYLAMHRCEPVPREKIAFALWPDDPEDVALANLRRYLYRITKQLLPAASVKTVLDIRARTIGFAKEAAEIIDVLRFERLVAQPGHEAAALETYGGELLEACEAPWLEFYREKLRSSYLAATRRCVEERREAGDLGGALAFAKRLARWDPLSEEALRLELEVRQDLGDRIGALRTYREFATRFEEEIGAPPAPQTRALYDAAVAAVRADVVRASVPRTRLPRPQTRFLGRDDDLAGTAALVTQHRLVTLVGIGGIGKTRLAIEVANALVDAFPDGVAFADLATIDDGSYVPAAVASALEAKDALAALAEREILLVLDNCERVVDGVKTFLASVRERAPRVHVLATSRVRLGEPGESVARVSPLDAASARDLFLERAYRSSSDGRSVDAVLLERLVCKLDRIPLAIEIAASRAQTLGLHALVDGLAEAFVMRERLGDGEKTMAEILAWHYASLDETARRMLRALSIVPGSWTLDLARDLVGDDVPAFEAFDAVVMLVDRALVAVVPSGVTTRYRLLETVRTFAATERERCRETEAASRRFVSAQINVARSIFEMLILSPTAVLVRTIRAELDNFRAVLELAFGTLGDIDAGREVLFAMGAHCWQHAVFEGMTWFDRAIGSPTTFHIEGSPAQRSLIATLFAHRAQSRSYLGRFRRAADDARVAIETFRELGDRRLGAVLALGASAEAGADRIDEAEAHSREAIDCLRRSTSRRNIVVPYVTLGRCSVARGDFAGARAALLDALAFAREVDDEMMMAFVFQNLAEAEFASGDHLRALAWNDDALELRLRTEQREEKASVLAQRALILCKAGRLVEAFEATVEAFRLAREDQAEFAMFVAMLAFATIAIRHGDARRAATVYGYVMSALADREIDLIGIYRREAAFLRDHLETVFDASTLAYEMRRGSLLTLERAALEAQRPPLAAHDFSGEPAAHV